MNPNASRARAATVLALVQADPDVRDRLVRALATVLRERRERVDLVRTRRSLSR